MENFLPGLPEQFAALLLSVMGAIPLGAVDDWTAIE
jgi:hypothetical protein